ncbi:MAG: hypothetical protein U0T68_05965 [Ferruginibacter sp.]
MQKRFILATAVLVIAIAALLAASSCKTIARAAARYWTKKQIKEFVGKCEDKSSLLLGSERAKKYCDCAVDVVAEKYRNYEDVKKASLTDILKIAQDCK